MRCDGKAKQNSKLSTLERWWWTLPWEKESTSCRGNAHSFSCGLMHVLHRGSVLNCPHIWAELCHSFWEAAVNWHQHLSTTMLEKHHRCRNLAQTLTDWFCPRRDNRVMGCAHNRGYLGGWGERRLEAGIQVTLARERRKTKEQNCFIPSRETLNKQQQQENKPRTHEG